jgi:two-component system alkaline phosphatase synthesis response regulator PhoP
VEILMTGEKIIVVDDEENIRELVKYNLDREGYRVTTVGSGSRSYHIGSHAAGDGWVGCLQRVKE